MLKIMARLRGVIIMRKGRRKKVRFVQSMPQTRIFSPRGKAGRPDEVVINLDQFEAIKLSDYQGYTQAEGAIALGVSRASFGRIIREARKMLADAIVNGKIIKIDTGNVQVGLKQKAIPAKDEIRKMAQNEETLRDNILQHLSFERKYASKNKKRNAKE